MKITIIAECGINWINLEMAKELILQAKFCGSDIAKFQLYSVDALFPDKQILAQGKNWYDEVKKTELSKEQAFELANYCKEVGIEFFASAFDLERLGWLEEIGVKRHKIGFRANRNKELINGAFHTGKEVLISRYPSSNFYHPGFEFLKYTRWLYCVPKYPSSLAELYFEDIDFNSLYSGFSDHSIGIEASMIAMSRGATIIEKHFCLKRDNSNPDMVCSIEPDELRQLVKFTRIVEGVLW